MKRIPASHDPKRAKEHPITEGRTYLARIIVCPWAYRKIKGYKSTRGRIVRVTPYSTVHIEWEGGAVNSVPRSCLRVIGEAL